MKNLYEAIRNLVRDYRSMKSVQKRHKAAKLLRNKGV